MDELTIDMLPLNEEELAWGGKKPESWYTDMIQETQDAQAAIIKQKKTVQYQTMLKQAGYYKGKIDGIWGRLTENAYKQYSRDSKGDGHRTVVKSGDTLSKIANKYGVSVQQIAAINPQITNINRIQVGQVINLPYFIKTSTSNSKSSPKSNASTGDIAYENSAKPLPEVVVTTKRANNSSNESKPFLHDALWSITGPIRALNAEATRFGEIYSDATMHSLNNLWKAPRNRKSYILPYKNNH